MQKSVDKKTIILILIIMVVSVVFVYRYIWPKYGYITQKTNTYNVEKYDSKPAVITQEKKPTPNKKEYKPDRCVLKKKNADIEEVIFDNENCNLEIVKWNEYLIFSEGNGYKKEDVILYAYQIKTGEKIKIYSLDEHASDYTERPYDIYVGDIFDNTLFFNAGGYMTDQVLYSLDLSDIKSKPKSVSNDKQYSRVIYSDGHYWITAMFGDAGYMSSNQALFDIKTKKIIGQEIKTASEMGIGTLYLGADDKSALIASFVANPNSQSEEDEYEPILSEIYSLDLMKKKDPKMIIGKKKMPSNIQRAVYLYDKKKIVLLGDDAYTYDLEEEKLKKIVSLKDVELGWLNTVSGNTICIAEKLKLDVEKKTLVTDETDCVHKSSMLEVKMSEKIKSFNLPPEYSFEFVKGQ